VNDELALALLLFTGSAVSVHAQDGHMPTVAQRQADVRSFSTGVQTTKPFTELSRQAAEMLLCKRVDSPNVTLYEASRGILSIVITARALRFIKRHNLVEQFEQENAAEVQGK
jgi:hypothetical protein